MVNIASITSATIECEGVTNNYTYKTTCLKNMNDADYLQNIVDM